MNPQPKTTRYENKKLLAFVRGLPCIRCRKPGPSDAHHVKGIGYLSGGGLKAPDWATMPLCLTCHDIVQKDALEDQWEWALRTIGMALDEGVIK